MTTIQQLPPLVVNKIAAGEVIERPASAVKELIENSIDAGATRIDVTVEQGGAQRIRVVDNGKGIAADELGLALASHATSKIRSDEDLFRVGTLGFRGEALASIASVSRFSIRSRTANAEAGAELQSLGGTLSDISPCGCPVGTTLEIEDLFFNTPVRRKFLRTPQTEMGHTIEAFTRLALAHSHIHFTLTNKDRRLHDLPPVESWRDRIALFFGQDLAGDLISIESEEEGTRLYGFVANPTHSRGNNRMQYLFLNGRTIRDRSLQHALREAYRGLLLTGRFPICFLHLDMPKELVDVNVHPTKMEVRFQDSGRLYSQLLGTLRTRFLSTDLTAKLEPTAAQSISSFRPFGESSPARPTAAAATRTEPTVPWPTTSASRQTADGTATLPMQGSAEPAFRYDPGASQPPNEPAGTPLVGTRPEMLDSDQALPAAPTVAIQVMNRYLVAESDDGVVVVDQHALHERILYEELRTKVLAGAMEAQNLLVPEAVDLSAAEAAAIIEARDLLAQLAVTVEPFGGSTVLISSYPAMLANFNPTELLRSLAEQLTAGGKMPDRRDLLDELLHMISCKAAIKAGDRLSADEVTALLAGRDLTQDAHHCPHGRPTALIFTREALDKQFKRT